MDSNHIGSEQPNKNIDPDSDQVVLGEISPGAGLREALERILSGAKSVERHGTLRIQSPSLQGRIGIVSGRFITGAEVAQGDLTGVKALYTLLGMRKGIYAFVVEESDTKSLKQSLALDIRQLLAVQDNKNKIGTNVFLDQALGILVRSTGLHNMLAAELPKLDSLDSQGQASIIGGKNASTSSGINSKGSSPNTVFVVPEAGDVNVLDDALATYNEELRKQIPEALMTGSDVRFAQSVDELPPSEYANECSDLFTGEIQKALPDPKLFVQVGAAGEGAQDQEKPVQKMDARLVNFVGAGVAILFLWLIILTFAAQHGSQNNTHPETSDTTGTGIQSQEENSPDNISVTGIMPDDGKPLVTIKGEHIQKFHWAGKNWIKRTFTYRNNLAAPNSNQILLQNMDNTPTH